MKNAICGGRPYLLSLLLVFLLFSGFIIGGSSEESTLEDKVSENVNPVKNQFKHLLLFNFSETTTPEEISKIVGQLTALESKIPEILDIESGLNKIDSGKSKGFTHCFIMTFENEEDLAVYIAHPAHKAFGKNLHPQLDDFLVFDYWTTD